MGHAYVTAEGCEEAIVLGVCSSTDESLLESLLSLHAEPTASLSAPKPESARPAGKVVKGRKR
jgi:hypothetical protein